MTHLASDLKRFREASVKGVAELLNELLGQSAGTVECQTGVMTNVRNKCGIEGVHHESNAVKSK